MQAYLQIDNGAPVTLTRAGTDYSATIPVPSVDGVDIVNKTLTVTAKDYEGNVAAPSINITKDDPDPSDPGETVTVQWTLSPSGAGAGTPTGTVTVTAADNKNVM